MSAIEDLMPDEDRRNQALDDLLANVLRQRDPLPLTAAELATLRLYSHGMTLPMVAETLCLSPHTIRHRTRVAREKLRAKTTAEACCEALRRRLIP